MPILSLISTTVPLPLGTLFDATEALFNVATAGDTFDTLAVAVILFRVGEVGFDLGGDSAFVVEEVDAFDTLAEVVLRLVSKETEVLFDLWVGDGAFGTSAAVTLVGGEDISMESELAAEPMALIPLSIAL